MYSMKQMCRMSGLSARALRFYHEQGLLTPAAVSESGYRFYDEETAARAKRILGFRSTGMSLDAIRSVLDSEDPECARRALQNRLRLLHEEQTRLERMAHSALALLAALENESEEESMNENYSNEAKQRWSNSAAYKDYAERLTSVGPEAMQLAGAALMDMLASFGELRGTEPDNPKAQETAGQLHKHLGDNFYDCSLDLLANLGEMYVEDPRFRQNIDKKGGEGTAAFARDAIRVYCAEKQ